MIFHKVKYKMNLKVTKGHKKMRFHRLLLPRIIEEMLIIYKISDKTLHLQKLALVHVPSWL